MYKASRAEQPKKGLKRSNGMLGEVRAAAPPPPLLPLLFGDSLTNRPANQTPTNKDASLGQAQQEAAMHLR